MWRKSKVDNLIENLAEAFDQFLRLAVYTHSKHGDAESIGDALSLAQGVIGEIAAEMRRQGTRYNVLQRDGLATLRARHDATELQVMPRYAAT